MRSAPMLVVLFAALTLGIPMAAGQATRLLSLPAAITVSEPPTADLSAPVSQPLDSLVVSQSAAPAPAAQIAGREFFQILNRSTGGVERVAALDYIRGAIASEMPATFHAEALAAQAVAAHTWALYSAELHEMYPDESLKGADFSADPDRDEGYVSQERFFARYGSTAELYWPKICLAADYAVGRALVYEEDLALTVYHSTSAGATESAQNVWSASLPYLAPVESEGDLLAPDFSVTENFPQTQLKTLLLSAFPEAKLDDADPEGWLEVLERSDSGYVTLVSVGGHEIHGQQLRTALSLRSTCMEISYLEGVFTIETMGYGHGVGMSQYGADFMARQGASCEDILSHYYPGTAIAAVA
jgi:stage II sporulation protein D